MKTFTKEQPKDGEIVVNCGHESAGKYHWYKSLSGVVIIQPEGISVGHWIVACEECHNKCRGDGTKIQIAGHGFWKGDEPHIYQNGESNVR